MPSQSSLHALFNEFPTGIIIIFLPSDGRNPQVSFSNSYARKIFNIPPSEKENDIMPKLQIEAHKFYKREFDKLTEILKNYEETPDSLNNKIEENNNEKLQKEKYENLLKKQKIISHSRLSMQKSYAQEIDKQKKYIEQLNNTIKEVDNVLSNLNS